YKALQVRDTLVNRHNTEPTLSQIAEEMGLPREEVVYALDAIQEPISLFEPIYHDGGDPIFVMDQISDERSEDGAWIEGISIREAMSRLSVREKFILTKRLIEGRNMMEVADEIGSQLAQDAHLAKAVIMCTIRTL